ncbi:MAG: cobalamin-dependent protein [Acidimicrobiales bacterium]
MPVTADAASHFLDLLAARDRPGALAFARRQLDAGASVADVVVDVLATAQRRVGELWEAGTWTVSQEHAATAIVEAVLADIASAPRQGSRGRVVLACCEQEWHSLPARMLSEMLEARSWEVTFLGASASADDLGEFLRDVDPIGLLVSCSVAMNLLGAARIVDAAHAAGYRVIAGGAALATAARADALGADGWAASIEQADAILDQWRAEPGLPRPVTRPGANAGSAIDGSQRELVDAAMAALAGRIPAVSRFTERQISRTRADYGYIVSFAAASVLLEDNALFDEFVEWLDGILVRLGHAGVLAVSLEVLASVARDHPELVELLGRS